jgi:exosortase A-associated hydrolase 2
MVEEPFFFENQNNRLFSVLHHPLDTSSIQCETGIVFCDPFAEEKLWAHRVFVNLARLLSKQSYWILRFDCMGHGDSDGNYADTTVETQLSDIREAVTVLRKRTKVKRVILLGARFGGTLAALAAAGNDQVHAIILWNPIINGEKYFQECLRSNLTTQMTTYHKINYTREQMVKDLLGGKMVTIDGYLISPEFYKQISQIRLDEAMRSYNKPLLMIQIHKEEAVRIDKELQGFYEKLKEADKPADFITVKGEPFWRELKIFPQKEDVLFNKTLEWIRVQEERSASEILDSFLLPNGIND